MKTERVFTLHHAHLEGKEDHTWVQAQVVGHKICTVHIQI